MLARSFVCFIQLVSIAFVGHSHPHVTRERKWGHECGDGGRCEPAHECSWSQGSRGCDFGLLCCGGPPNIRTRFEPPADEGGNQNLSSPLPSLEPYRDDERNLLLLPPSPPYRPHGVSEEAVSPQPREGYHDSPNPPPLSRNNYRNHKPPPPPLHPPPPTPKSSGRQWDNGESSPRHRWDDPTPLPEYYKQNQLSRTATTTTTTTTTQPRPHHGHRHPPQTQKVFHTSYNTPMPIATREPILDKGEVNVFATGVAKMNRDQGVSELRRESTFGSEQTPSTTTSSGLFGFLRFPPATATVTSAGKSYQTSVVSSEESSVSSIEKNEAVNEILENDNSDLSQSAERYLTFASPAIFTTAPSIWFNRETFPEKYHREQPTTSPSFLPWWERDQHSVTSEKRNESPSSTAKSTNEFYTTFVKNHESHSTEHQVIGNYLCPTNEKLVLPHDTRSESQPILERTDIRSFSGYTISSSEIQNWRKNCPETSDTPSTPTAFTEATGPGSRNKHVNKDSREEFNNHPSSHHQSHHRYHHHDHNDQERDHEGGQNSNGNYFENEENSDKNNSLGSKWFEILDLFSKTTSIPHFKNESEENYWTSRTQSPRRHTSVSATSTVRSITTSRPTILSSLRPSWFDNDRNEIAENGYTWWFRKSSTTPFPRREERTTKQMPQRTTERVILETPDLAASGNNSIGDAVVFPGRVRPVRPPTTQKIDVLPDEMEDWEFVTESTTRRPDILLSDGSSHTHPRNSTGSKSRQACVRNKDILKLTSYIIGGDYVMQGEFPHMAALGFQKPREPQLSWLCGGTLISERFVLTAAHCIDTSFGEPKAVRVGYTNLTADAEVGTEVRVAASIGHPGFDRRTRAHDIALLRLAAPVASSQFAHPACLPDPASADPPPGSDFIISGWGSVTSDGATPTDYMRKATISVMSAERCAQVYPDVWRSEMLCAGSEKTIDTCKGDSGGPLQALDDATTFVYSVVGVTSFGPTPCGGLKPGVYTRVASYIDWIESIVWP